MGDFNTCLLKGDSRCRRLMSIAEAFNLHILPLTATHNLPNCTPSLLDLMLVTAPASVSKFGQCAADAFSYHDLIYLSYKLRPPKAKSRTILQRSFGRMDLDCLRKDAQAIEWFTVTEPDSIDDKINIFNSLITQLYDSHAPLKIVKIKHLSAPWLSEDLKKLIAKKHRAKSNFRANSSDANREKYHRIRNRCNTMCRDAQRRHIHTSVENGDTAKVWKFLKSLGVGKLTNNSSPNNIDVELLNKHFSSSSLLDDIERNRTLNFLSKLPTPNFQPFNFLPFSECDVKRHIVSISSNAVGTDSVGRNMILPILDIILPILTYILNESIFSGHFPKAWKSAQIIPIPKKPNPSDFSDFRPISILPFLSKVLEKLVHHQLSTYLNEHSLLNSFQSGFRPGHGTVSALIKVTDDIRWGMDNKQITILTLLDFSNAFNVVDHEILVSLLRSFNISPPVMSWFQDYLEGRRQRIKIDESFSSWHEVRAGVPQGGVLSPLLFTIFINSISQNLTSLYHMYADDLQIYTRSSLDNLSSAVASTNSDLATICQWSKSFGLKVNPSKSQTIVIGSPNIVSRIDWSRISPILYDNVIIPYSSVVKNLGIFFYVNLSWVHHIKELSKKTFAAVRSLRRLQSFLPISTKTMLAQSLLLSVLDYADASYPNITEEQLNKLERLQNVAIRFVFGLRKFDHVSEFRAKLKWLPIRLRRNLHILSLLYCVLFSPTSPTYMKEKFEFIGDHSKVLRSSENLTLRLPMHKTKFFKQSFEVQAILLWNALPLSIRKAESLDIFKRRVKDYYLSLN
ncbi:unnamed protein product [Euphydryas editha]|uniref:Reverse transcriptase domain-containing protein n=1 Tax=Euphydryas editha TaxID=104508 RepID=A0AAU9U7W0_EUPED|nr:unnamed protein product [Euphydryas editha]